MYACGIKRSQFTILGNLGGRGVIIHSELADRLYMDRTTLTRNLKPLERQGLIVVRTSATDARAREISLTNLGEKKLKEAQKLWEKAQRKLLGIFGEENWDELEALLHKLRDIAVKEEYRSQ